MFKPCHFCVPQGSVLGPLLSNLYVNDLQDIDRADLVNTCQYADDTTQYEHFKISQIRQTVQNTQNRLDNLIVWSRNNNILLNGTKMKYIISSTSKIKQNLLQDFEYSSKHYRFTDVVLFHTSNTHESNCKVSCLPLSKLKMLG